MFSTVRLRPSAARAGAAKSASGYSRARRARSQCPCTAECQSKHPKKRRGQLARRARVAVVVEHVGDLVRVLPVHALEGELRESVQPPRLHAFRLRPAGGAGEETDERHRRRTPTPAENTQPADPSNHHDHAHRVSDSTRFDTGKPESAKRECGRARRGYTAIMSMLRHAVTHRQPGNRPDRSPPPRRRPRPAMPCTSAPSPAPPAPSTSEPRFCDAAPTDALTKRLEPDNLQLRAGALVTAVINGGVAQVAGLQAGDVIYRVGGVDVEDNIETTPPPQPDSAAPRTPWSTSSAGAGPIW